MLARGSRHVHTGGALEPTDGAPHNLLSAGESNICAQPVTLYGSLSVLACPDTEPGSPACCRIRAALTERPPTKLVYRAVPKPHRHYTNATLP